MVRLLKWETNLWFKTLTMTAQGQMSEIKKWDYRRNGIKAVSQTSCCKLNGKITLHNFF